MALALRIVLITIAAMIGLVGGAIGLFAIDIWYHNNYKTELQTLDVPARRAQFVLMRDISGFEDPAWYVYEIPTGAKPPPTMRKAHDHSDAIFWNYDEANQLTEDAKLEVAADRFLVFSREGLRFALYDMDSRKVLVNDTSPWHSYYRAGGDAKYGPRGQGPWVRETLQREIDERIARSTNSLPAFAPEE